VGVSLRSVTAVLKMWSLERPCPPVHHCCSRLLNSAVSLMSAAPLVPCSVVPVKYKSLPSCMWQVNPTTNTSAQSTMFSAPQVQASCCIWRLFHLWSIRRFLLWHVLMPMFMTEILDISHLRRKKPTTFRRPDLPPCLDGTTKRTFCGVSVWRTYSQARYKEPPKRRVC
jgi:hypothetical protein